MVKECFIQIKDKLLEAEFIRVFQYSTVIESSIMAGGHNSEAIAYPDQVAVVRIDEKLKEVPLSDVIFKK